MKKKTRLENSALSEHLLENSMFETPCASYTDCTGCVPRIPDGEHAAESYRDVSSVNVTGLDGSSVVNTLGHIAKPLDYKKEDSE